MLLQNQKSLTRPIDTLHRKRTSAVNVTKANERYYRRLFGETDDELVRQVKTLMEQKDKEIKELKESLAAREHQLKNVATLADNVCQDRIETIRNDGILELNKCRYELEDMKHNLEQRGNSRKKLKITTPSRISPLKFMKRFNTIDKILHERRKEALRTYQNTYNPELQTRNKERDEAFKGGESNSKSPILKRAERLITRKPSPDKDKRDAYRAKYKKNQ